MVIENSTNNYKLITNGENECLEDMKTETQALQTSAHIFNNLSTIKHCHYTL